MFYTVDLILTNVKQKLVTDNSDHSAAEQVEQKK